MTSYPLIPPLACLILVSFIWAVSLGGSPEILGITIAPLLLILSVSFITLAKIRTYEREAISGVLMFLVGNRTNLSSYSLKKITHDGTHLVFPLTLCSIALLELIHPSITLVMLILFGATHFITSLSALILTHLLSSFSIRSDHSSLLSLFILWPLLIPTLILSLTTLQGNDASMNVFDTICLNFSLLMLTFGGVSLVIPHLLTSAFDE